MRKEISEVLGTCGYRYIRVQPEEAGVFYKFQDGAFWVFLVVDDQDHLQLTVPKLETMMESVRNLFYHPENHIPGFDGLQRIKEVRLMTLVFGYRPDEMHILCANVDNLWAYDQTSGHLIIYENQPDDFDGLRNQIENITIIESAPISNARTEFPGAAAQPANRWKSIRDYTKWTVTIALILTNVLVFIIFEILGSTENAQFMLEHGANYPVNVLDKGEYWRLFTSMFLHFGLRHLLNNMIILGAVGAKLEEALGHVKYLILYLLAGLGGSVLSVTEMVHTGDYAVSAGASGAIFGAIGALLWVVIRNRGHYETLTTRGLIFMILLCLYFGVSTAGVDNWAHFGGLIAGFVLSIIFYHRKRQKH